MKKVYLVYKDTYSSSAPIFATDTYNDALHLAASYKEYDDEKAKKLVKAIPLLTTEPVTLNHSDLNSVVDRTIDITLRAYQAVSDAKVGGTDE